MNSEYSGKAAGGSVLLVRDQWRLSPKRSYSPKVFAKSEVVGQNLEERLRVRAGRTFLRGFRAGENEPAVAAFPRYGRALFEHLPVGDVLGELQIALFVVLFHRGYVFKYRSDFGKSLLFGVLRALGVNFRLLFVFSGGRHFEACGGVAGSA